MDRHTVLFVGFDPGLMNLEGAPTGTAESIQAGIDRSMRELDEGGYDARYCALAEGNPNAVEAMRIALAAQSYGCVVIGAGLRFLPQHTSLFEALVNVAVESAPGARLAFNATPAEAVRRQLA